MSYEKTSNETNLDFKRMSRYVILLLSLVSSYYLKDLHSGKNEKTSADNLVEKILKEEDVHYSQKDELTNLIERSINNDNNDLLYQRPSYKYIGFHKDFIKRNSENIDKLEREKFWSNHKYLKRARKEYKDGLNTLRFIENVVEDFKFKKLPQAIQEKIKPLILGIASQESKLEKSAISKDGAKGYFQIIDVTYKDLLAYLSKRKRQKAKYEDLRYDLKIATELALVHIDRFIYPKIKDELFKIMRILDMQEEEWFEFATLSIINAYNTGQGVMENVLKRFIAYLTSVRQGAPGNPSYVQYKIIKQMSPLELFLFMSSKAKNEKWDKRYKEHSSTYTRLVLAGASASLKILDKTAGNFWWTADRQLSRVFEKLKPKRVLAQK